MGRGKKFCIALCMCVMAGAVAVGAETEEEAGQTEYGGSLEPQRIVVTATRIPTEQGRVAGSVSVFTPEVMEQRQYRTVDEALQQTPGLSLNRSGGPGGITSVFMRGMDSGRTVVLMDGMPINDPANVSGGFDFGGITLDNIGQLEVLRGPQSTLYGSNASGGVVNITSKRGAGPLTGFFATEGGSRGTFMTRVGASAGGDKADFSFAGSFTHTDGISSIDKKYGNSEKDGYNQGTMSLRLGANPTDFLRLDLFANYQQAEFELDSGRARHDKFPSLESLDNPHYKQRMERFMIRPQATMTLFDGLWEQIVGFGYVRTERKYKDDPYPGNRNAYYPYGAQYEVNRNKYAGETYRFDYQSIFRPHETNTLLVGVDSTTESMKLQPVAYKPGHEYPDRTPDVTPRYDPGSVTTVGVYLEDRVSIRDSFFATLGGRYDHNDDYGDKLTWKGSLMYVLPTATKLKASAGTGFKAPSLYQVHGYTRWYQGPNESLKPETSFGWDMGFEQEFMDERLVLGATYFQNRVKNMFEWQTNPLNGLSTCYNVGRAKTWGVEAFFTFLLTDELTLSGQYTWLRTENRETGQALLRRPLNEGGVNLDWRFCGKGTLTAGVRYVGRRADMEFEPAYPYGSSRVKMPSYAVARIGASWKFNDNFEVYGRVENLFNKKYQEVYEYGSERIGVYAGMTLSF